MANIEDYFKVIEAAITELGVEPDKCRDEKEQGAWALSNGQQEVWLDCWHIEAEDQVYFQALSPVLEIPNDMDAPFYREVLEINYNLFGVAFGVYKNMLAIKVIREAKGMDKDECRAMITRVGNYAAEYGPVLAEKYFNSDPNTAPDA